MTAAHYSNILLPVSSPTESIWFPLCLLFFMHYRGYCCQKKLLSLLPTVAFHFSPRDCLCFVLAPGFKRQLSKRDQGSAGQRYNSDQKKKIKLLLLLLEQLAESPCSDKMCQPRTSGAIGWKKDRIRCRYRG